MKDVRCKKCHKLLFRLTKKKTSGNLIIEILCTKCKNKNKLVFDNLEAQ